uniref:Uncharacterized protein n=1 Tax=Timema douglasi TaxID=61478 RepID=A0A7R8ZHN2_TIMDO|nr:unnamed protein product [Timema douglasi]
MMYISQTTYLLVGHLAAIRVLQVSSSSLRVWTSTRWIHLIL